MPLCLPTQLHYRVILIVVMLLTNMFLQNARVTMEIEIALIEKSPITDDNPSQFTCRRAAWTGIGTCVPIQHCAYRDMACIVRCVRTGLGVLRLFRCLAPLKLPGRRTMSDQSSTSSREDIKVILISLVRQHPSIYDPGHVDYTKQSFEGQNVDSNQQ
ncbi:hypothetical protein RRG08_049671 [Elysia crispata]|uniref:Uncharacterized protein n=1 Tax=Elysia crispata TaxID=231223 RepID=A0AAE1CTF3_9GAST|nr:hypothetical protein RRG08_049671 [Elysia crispata]